jgi:VanZ family protein
LSSRFLESAWDTLRWPVAVGYLLGTFFFGTVPKRAPLEIQSDKLLHSAVFFGMVLVSFPAIAGSLRDLDSRARRACNHALAYALAVGALLELVQGALPARKADAEDLLANAVGAGLAYLILRGAELWQRRATS